MNLENISYCRFLTKIDQQWTDDQWRARDIVRAIKGESFGGSVRLRFGGKTRILDKDHPEVAFDWFIESVKAQTRFSPGRHSLCPIPDRKCTVSANRVSKTMALAQRLSAAIPDLEIWDGLRFVQEMPSSRETNMRDSKVIYNALRLISKVPTDTYIIVLDDVCTSGSHARAAAQLITANANVQVCAMSVARTMLDRDEEVFGFRSDPI